MQDELYTSPVVGRKRKGSRSNTLSNVSCVEIAPLANGGVEITDSKDPGRPGLRYTGAEFAVLVRAIKDGEFDDLVTVEI